MAQFKKANSASESEKKKKTTSAGAGFVKTGEGVKRQTMGTPLSRPVTTNTPKPGQALNISIPRGYFEAKEAERQATAQRNQSSSARWTSRELEALAKSNQKQAERLAETAYTTNDDKQIAELKRLREQAAKYSAAADKKKAEEKQKANAEKATEVASYSKKNDFETKAAEGAQMKGNAVQYVKDNWGKIAAGSPAKKGTKLTYRHLTDDEVKTYNYILAKEGKDKAQEYLDMMEDTLNQREGQSQFEHLKTLGDADYEIKTPQYGNNNKYLTDKEARTYEYLAANVSQEEADKYLESKQPELQQRKMDGEAFSPQIDKLGEKVATGVHGIMAGGDQWSQGVKQTFSNDLLTPTGTQYASGAVIEQLQKQGGGSMAYQAANTVGNMLPSILISTFVGGPAGMAGWADDIATAATTASTVDRFAKMAGTLGNAGAKLGSAAMFLGANGNAYSQARQEGYSEGQARLYGLLVGASEVAMQNLIGGITPLKLRESNIEKWALGLDRGWKRALALLGSNMLSETIEEEVQLFVEPAFAAMITGKDYEVPAWEEILSTALITFLSTGALEGVSSVQKATSPEVVIEAAIKNYEKNLEKYNKEANSSVSPAASEEVQQADVASNAVAASNPESTVLNAATTILMEKQGLDLKTATKRAEIIQKLVDGVDMKPADFIKMVNRLDPKNPTTQAIFTELTGVEFPENKGSIEVMYNTYRSAHEVAQQRVEENKVAAETASLNPETPVAAEPVMQEDLTAIPAEAAAARPGLPAVEDVDPSESAEMMGELDADGVPRRSFAKFKEELTAAHPELASAPDRVWKNLYGKYLGDGETVDANGKRMTHEEFMSMDLRNEDGSLATPEQKQAAWDEERAAQQRKALAREREQKKSVALTSEQKVSVEKWNKVLKSYNLEVEWDENLSDNEPGRNTGKVIQLNPRMLKTEEAVSRIVAHEMVHGIKDKAQKKAMVNDIISVLHPEDVDLQNILDRYETMYREHDEKLRRQAEAEGKEFTPAEIDDDYVREEYAGDLMRRTFNDGALRRKLAHSRPGKINEILRILDDLASKFTGKEKAEIKALKERFTAALATNQKDANSSDLNEDFAQARSALVPPYRNGTAALDEFVAGLPEEARSTYDMFLNINQIGENNMAVIPVGSGEKVHDKAVNITKQYMLASEWNALHAERADFAFTAKLLADSLPEKVRNAANLKEDGTIVETPFEKEFKMERSFIQRIVDSLPMDVGEPKMVTDGRAIKLSNKKSIYFVGGEQYRRALVEERRALYRAGKLPTKSIAGMSKDTWGAMGFLATNTKTGASGDFTTICPQMYFNRGCFYCYRRAALESGVNNKLTGETVWYTGEILHLSEADIADLNKNGGLRIQSFGDWMDKFSSELADLLIDAEMVGLQVKIITKEPSMISTVALLKEQGLGNNLYFNLSADYAIEKAGDPADKAFAPMNPDRPFMRDEKGTMMWKRAMTVEEAAKFRDKYDWVNTRIVATTIDEFIEGLKSPVVDVVTGYHGNIRQYERISSATGETLIEMEAVGDAGMPRFAYDVSTNRWNLEYEGKTSTHKKLAKAIADAGLEYEYYTKSCCITGRCATCNGKCGKLAKDFYIKNATNRDQNSVAYWQEHMMSLDPEERVEAETEQPRYALSMDETDQTETPRPRYALNSEAETDSAATVAIAFKSDQVKSAINKEPTHHPDTRYALVEDPETIDFLENQEYITVYKAMAKIDGKYYPPMSSLEYVDEEYTDKKGNKKTRRVRKLKNPSIFGRWQAAVESPEVAEKSYDPKKGYSMFDLLKSSNSKDDIPAAYNPYEHTSSIVLNDQFTTAYKRPELVTVEYRIPVSELTSGYKAQYAKDPVGLTDWKAGGVAQKLQNTHRDVYLTRWSKPVRELSDAEVAQKYKEIMDKEPETIKIPWNVVTENLRHELEKVGVAIDYSDASIGSNVFKFEDVFPADYAKLPDAVKQEAAAESDRKAAERQAKAEKKAAKKSAETRYAIAGELADNPWQKATLDTAKQMKKDGKSKNLVRLTTGWWWGPDNKWRFEIDDSGAKLLRDTGSGTLGDFLDHPVLYKNYPGLEKIQVEVDIDPATQKRRGYFDGATNTLHINKKLKDENFKETLMHELQHLIQRVEGFERGSNLDVAYRDEFINAYKALKNTPQFKQLQTYESRVEAIENEILKKGKRTTNADEPAKRLYDAVHATYSDVVGENEARNTADRRDLIEIERQLQPPYMGDTGGSSANWAQEKADYNKIHRLLGHNGVDKPYAPLYNEVRKNRFGPNDGGIELSYGYEDGFSGAVEGDGRRVDARDFSVGSRGLGQVDTTQASEESGASFMPETKRYAISEDVRLQYKHRYGTENPSDKTLMRHLERVEKQLADEEYERIAADTIAYLRQQDEKLAIQMYTKRKLRQQHQRDQANTDARVAKEREAKKEALKTAKIISDAEKAVTNDAWKMFHTRKMREQHVGDVAKQKELAAKRLKVKEDAYAEYKEAVKERSKLRRNAAKTALRDKRRVDEKRAEIEKQQGLVDTIRKMPAQRSMTEKIQDEAQKLRTLGRTAYRNFVNVAAEIDRFSKRQISDTRAGDLVTLLGGSSTTVEQIFKTGLVSRTGDRVKVNGKELGSMKDVFLCMDKKGKVNENMQALLQDYMLHLHNQDRMSFVPKAEAALAKFEAEHPYIAGLNKETYAKLVAQTDAETAKLRNDDMVKAAREYAQLIRARDEAQNVPIFADKNGNAVTAETSKQRCEELLAQNPWLEEKAQGIYEWWDAFMRNWAVGDSISLEQYEAMRRKYPHYVPTYRQSEKGIGAPASVTSRSATPGKATQRATGSFREVVNIEDSFTKMVGKIVKLSRTNELYKNMLDTAMLDNDGAFEDMIVFNWDWQDGAYGRELEEGAFFNGDFDHHIDNNIGTEVNKTDGGYTLSAWYDGVKFSAYISEDLFTSIAGVTGNLDQGLEKLTQIGNTLTSPMKSMITGNNPIFGLRNVIRDLSTAMINTRVTNSMTGMAFYKYWAQAINEIRKGSDHWHNFVALGGTHSTYYNDSVNPSKALYKEKGLAGKMWETFGKFNEVTESATRFAEYLATVERLGDTYENRIKGIKNAAEVTVDFSRKGRYGKTINAWVPYWNPAVQGIDKQIRALVEAPEGSTIVKQVLKTGGRAMLNTVLLETIMQAILKYTDRDDEWEELDDRTKDAYYCIPLKDEHRFLKIPKSREWSAILGNPFWRLLEYANGRDNPFENYLETSIEASYIPPAIFRLDRENGFDTDIVLASIALDLARNEDFAGRTIVPSALQSGSLDQQFDKDTSFFAKQLGDLINFSPMQIDYFIESYCGDFGQLFIEATSAATWTGDRTIGDTLYSIAISPWIKDNRYSNYATSAYYDRLGELDKVVQDKKNQLGTEEYKNTKEYQVQKALQELYGNDISDLNKMARELPDGPEKDAVKETLSQTIAEAIEYYDRAMAGQIDKPILDAEYRNCSDRVANELIRLDGYKTDYNFAPRDSAPTSYVDPYDNDYEFKFTDDQKDKYMDIYMDIYNNLVSEEMSSSYYRNSSDEEKAGLLLDAKEEANDQAKEEFLEWIEKQGVRSTKKKGR